MLSSLALTGDMHESQPIQIMEKVRISSHQELVGSQSSDEQKRKLLRRFGKRFWSRQILINEFIIGNF